MVLSIMAQTTPLWLKKTDGTNIIICTAYGAETITIDENGNKVPNLPTDIKNHCAMCLVAAQSVTSTLSLAGTLPLPHIRTTAAQWTAQTSFIVKKQAASGHAIRAPPLNA